MKINKAALSLKIITALLILLTITAALIPTSNVLAADPVVTTDSATDTTESSATLNATLSDLGTVSTTYVYLSFDYCTGSYWDTYGSYDQVTAEQAWLVDNGVTTFSDSVTGLINSSDYHFRAKVRYGTSYVYGTDQSFSTNMLAPDGVPEVLLLQAYKNLIETDDCLFLILADISYNTLPNISVNRAYVWSMILDGVGDIGWNVGYAMNDLGYGLNLFALYFDAADAIDWGNNEDYYLQLKGSGAVFPTDAPLYDSTDDPNYAVTADTWVSAVDYNTELAGDLLSIVSTLEQEWQIVLLDEQDTKTVLSSDGEKLLRNVIPGVQVMAPAIFYVQSLDADVDPRAWGTSLDSTYKQRLLGADGQPGGGDDNWIAGSFLGVAEWLNIPWLTFMGFLCMAMCAYVVYLSVKQFGNPGPGYLGCLLIILCFGLLVLGLTIVALIAFILTLIGGWMLLMKKS